MKTTLLFLLVSLSGACLAQTTITGNVTDEHGEPLIGVNVYIRDSYDGATTGIDGTFSFSTSEDNLVLIASSVGFHEAQLPLELKNQSISIILKEKIDQLDAVVITAGAFTASEEQQREVLKPLDIVTTAGATADIPGALNTLPGTQTVGETGRLFVRGGDSRETKTFIDGMLVNDAYGPAAPNTPGRSRFSPFMFKGMSFSTGGYSAEYGQALSSALVLQSKDKAENNRTDISLMTVGGDISATRSFDDSSIAGKLQYTNLTPYFALAPQRLDWSKAPEGIDGNVAYRLKTSHTGMLKLYGLMSSSRMKLFESEIGNPGNLLPVVVNNDYLYINASYRELLSDKWGIRSGVSWNKSDDEASLGTNSRSRQLQGNHVKVAADYQHSDRLSVLMGAETLYRHIDQALLNESARLQQQLTETVAATFAESELFVSAALAFKAGLRMEYNHQQETYAVNPRLSAAYKTGRDSQVSLAYGTFEQAAETQILLTDPEARPETAAHYIANYQWSRNGRSFRAELYEKQYQQLTRYGSEYDATTFSFNGDGHARGLDIFWRDNKTFKGTDYWVSYSYLNTSREHKDFPGSYTPQFASAHNVSVVVKKFIEDIKSQVGLTYTFASGRAYHNVNSDQFMAGRTPSFHDLSFNISYLYSSQVIIHAMVNNVLGINNVFGYDYADTRGTDGMFASRAITPPAKRFIFLGVFITLSKNKGINQLPNL